MKKQTFQHQAMYPGQFQPQYQPQFQPQYQPQYQPHYQPQQQQVDQQRVNQQRVNQQSQISPKKVCVYFLNGSCKRGNSCNLIHDNKLCKFWFNNQKCPRGDNCNFNHFVTSAINNNVNDGNNGNNNNNKNAAKRKIVNTETFKPSHKRPDMRVLINDVGPFMSYDVTITKDLFKDENSMYSRLMDEMQNTGINQDDLYKSWHGDTHWIADDSCNWKDKCPTFIMVLDVLKKHFNLDIKSTRFNLYEDSNEWKPFHHDAAAIKEDKAKTQNFTVGVSFGATRDICFEHAKTKTTVSFPLSNGAVYSFGKDVNVEWRHGIPQLPPENKSKNGRISIIAWSWSNNVQQINE